MAPHSSPPSSAASPSLKRKQPTISSFFTQKPASGQQLTDKTAGTEASIGQRSKKRQASPTQSGHELQQADLGRDEEDDDEDVIIRPAKRARTSVIATEEAQRSSVETKFNAPSQLSCSQHTELSRFQSSPAVTTTNIEDETDSASAQRRKEREKLHQKFVRKLGGPDCLVGIGRGASSDSANVVAEVEEGDEEEETPPLPPPTKGKGTSKRGSGKLTPMEKQVIEIKRKHLDTVMAIQVGYKFHFYGEDARIAAKELNIVCIPGKLRFDERMLRRRGMIRIH